MWLCSVWYELKLSFLWATWHSSWGRIPSSTNCYSWVYLKRSVGCRRQYSAQLATSGPIARYNVQSLWQQQFFIFAAFAHFELMLPARMYNDASSKTTHSHRHTLADRVNEYTPTQTTYTHFNKNVSVAIANARTLFSSIFNNDKRRKRAICQNHKTTRKSQAIIVNLHFVFRTLVHPPHTHAHPHARSPRTTLRMTNVRAIGPTTRIRPVGLTKNWQAGNWKIIHYQRLMETEGNSRQIRLSV